MSQKQSRKHARELARRARLADRARRRAAYESRAPFRFEPGDAPQAFVALVRDAARRMDPAPFEDVFTLVREEGAQALGGLSPGARNNLLVALGQAVFDKVPRERLLRFIPFHVPLFVPHGRGVVVDFLSLKQAKGPGGTVYYSKREPKVQLDGRSLTVGFSGHACLRLAERQTSWPSYPAARDAFYLLDRGTSFEVDGSPAFSFWTKVDPGTRRYELAAELLGYVTTGDVYCRVGWCPAVAEGHFLKAKTLIHPGGRGTPEHHLLPREMRELAERPHASLNPEAVEVLRWLHSHRVPQVWAADRPGLAEKE